MKDIITTTLKIEKELMKELKIKTIEKEMTQNDLIIHYIAEGIAKDKE